MPKGKRDYRPSKKRTRVQAPPAVSQARIRQAVMAAKPLKGMDTAVDLAITNVIATTNTNGAIAVLNLVRSGNGSWNRLGNKIALKSVHIRMLVTMFMDDVLGVNTPITGCMRMVLVWDKQPSGAAVPTFDTIFGRTAQDGTEDSTYLAPLRYDNTGRFRIIRDWSVLAGDANITSTSDTNQWTHEFNEYVPLKGLETIYSGESEPQTIADISTGALYLVFRSNINSTQNKFSTSLSNVRLRFYDA